MPDESDAQGASPVVVLSHRFWMRSFNADPGIVGQTVRLNRHPVTVVGVAPEGFQGTTVVAVDLWVPMSLVTLVTGASRQALEARRAGWLVMGARLRAGRDLAQAAADVAAHRPGASRAVSGPAAVRSRSVVLAGTPMADKMPLAAAV